MIIKDKKFNFLGDSITEGAGASCNENIYLNVIKERCGLAVARNYGIGGTRIARQKGVTVDCPRFDRDFCMRVEEMDSDADFVVVFGGTNDFGHGDAPFGTKNDRTPDTFIGACHYLMRALLEKYCGKQIIFMTPLHRTGESVPRFDGHVLSDFVDVIIETAGYYGIPVLNLFAVSGIQPEIECIKEKYAPDGLHPSDDGNEVIAERLSNFIMGL